ncbi:MAG: phage tail protein [Rhabdochlamydiaceae bacterium]
MAAGGPFTSLWNAAYEGLPADTENISLGAGRIRVFKEDIRERMQTDHLLAGTNDDGCHQQITVHYSTVDPPAYTFSSDGTKASFLYTKAVSGTNELFWEDSAARILQLTTGGAINLNIPQSLPSGSLIDFAGLNIPSGYLECNGQSISTSTYAALFSAIGYTWGGSGGSFNVPNLNGYVTMGRNGSYGAGNLGQSYGENTHTLSISEIPSHNHSISDPGHNHTLNTGQTIQNGATFSLSSGNLIEYFTPTLAAAVTGITIDYTGGGASHNNMQPTAVVIKLIKT